MATYYSPKIVTDGLRLYYDAGNRKSYPGSGATWYDLSGNGYNGTLLNNPTYSDNNGGYIYFDGYDDNVDTGKTASQLGIYDTSYTTWAACYFRSVTNDNMIYGTNQPNARQGMHLGVRNGNWYFGHYASDASGGTASTNTWYVITWVFDGSTARIYVNGVLTVSGNISSFIGTTNILMSGSWGYPTSSNTNIAIGAIYNRAFNQTEVFQNFDAVRTRFGL